MLRVHQAFTNYPAMTAVATGVLARSTIGHYSLRLAGYVAAAFDMIGSGYAFASGVDRMRQGGVRNCLSGTQQFMVGTALASGGVLTGYLSSLSESEEQALLEKGEQFLRSFTPTIVYSPLSPKAFDCISALEKKAFYETNWCVPFSRDRLAKMEITDCGEEVMVICSDGNSNSTRPSTIKWEEIKQLADDIVECEKKYPIATTIP